MGQHCSEQSCKQLDFLPMKCDACVLVFCKDHLLYDLHNCASKYKKDVQVPVCPLCNSPVPVARGSLPDSAVSTHIERGCARVTKEKVFNNACSKHKCKKKEMVPLTCDACKQNFCLGHRHPQDHDCKGKVGAREAAAAAAANRQAAAAAATGHSRPTPAQKRITSFFSGAPVQGGRPTVGASSSGASGGSGGGRTLRAGTETARSLQPGGLSEDEALAAALAASLAGPEQQGDVRGGGQLSQEEEDRLLAQALAESERTARREGRSVAAGGSSQADKSCSMQ